MPLNDKNYENHYLQELPPHARDIAQFLYNGKPLVFFIQQWTQPNPDKELMDQKKVPHALWNDIIEAAFLAKLTYIQPNDKFNKDQLLFLIHTSCQIVKMPLNEYSMDEIIETYRDQMPKYCKWLLEMMVKLRQASN